MPVWVGDGWRAQEYQTAATVGVRVRIIPGDERCRGVLNALDVYCLASPGEGFSIGTAGGMVAGTTTVATPVGSVPDWKNNLAR